MTVDALPDVSLERKEAIESSKTSLDFFAALLAPEVFRFCFPPIFIAIWQLLTTSVQEVTGKKRLAIGLPRGFGKTFLLKLFVAWVIAFTDRKFILVVCNTVELAEHFISDVQDLLNGLNFLRVFGDWRLALEKDTQTLKKFSFRGRPVIIAGLGATSSLRGLNLKFSRPDVIIMDDMQSKEQAASPTDSSKILSWMIGTLMKAADNTRCLYVFIGNMYPHEGSILKKLKHNSAWISFVTGAILEDGESLWPELRSIDDILTELENDESLGHPEIFFSEVMNDDEAGSRAGVDFSKINVWIQPDTRPDEPIAGWVIIDPSLGKKTSDSVAIGAFVCYGPEPVLKEAIQEKLNPGQTVDAAIKMAAKYNLQAIVVESVAYQASLCYWLSLKLAQLGLHGTIKVLEVSPEGESKVSRILQMFKQLTAEKERIWIVPQVRSAVVHQITYYDPLKVKNVDDLLDLLAYAYKVMHRYPNEIFRALDMLVQEAKASFSEDLQLDF